MGEKTWQLMPFSVPGQPRRPRIVDSSIIDAM